MASQVRMAHGIEGAHVLFMSWSSVKGWSMESALRFALAFIVEVSLAALRICISV